MASKTKDTVYIDVDDEITSIVDKVQASDSNIVALVLPKRAAALQSIVNMKLLKRAADESGKKAVLITSENGLLPLAGATGLHVAKNLQSKPEIPDAPDSGPAEDEEIEAAVEDAPPVDASKSVGELAGEKAVEDTVEIPDSSAKGTKANKSKGKKNKDKKPKVPNFELFRKKLFLVIAGLVGLILLWYLAVVVAPKATIAIETNTESSDASLQFTASPEADELDEEDLIVPAERVESKKEDSERVTATGKKDLGAKASGSMTLSIACSDVDTFPVRVPAGTGVSTSGRTYITQSTATLSSPGGGGGCSFSGSTKVTAQEKGEEYNRGPANYSVAGYPDVEGSGGSMTGGSSKIATVVSEQDVSNAKKELTQDDDEVKAQLRSELEEAGLFVIEESFKKSNESTSANPQVGQEASETTVSYSVTYSMIGVEREDLVKLIENSLADQIDTERQQIQKDGLDDASFEIDSTSGGNTLISLNATVAVGPDINVDELKNQILGQKRGDTENIVRELPGVNDVQVKYSPFWVSSTPKKATKINFEFTSASDSE